MTRAEEAALRTYPYEGGVKGLICENSRQIFIQGYEQAEKDIKEAIVKHFKYKQDHSPEHTLHWWVYKNVIDKVNEL